ncbi:reverse transcriptase domain-containing protein [Tanacetum coccineum]
MTDKYCPQGEIKKLEIELWNLKVKGNDVLAYTERFQELTLICTKFVANETEKKLRTYAERQSDNKRKADDSSRNNHGHQSSNPFKRAECRRSLQYWGGERKPSGGIRAQVQQVHLQSQWPVHPEVPQKCKQDRAFALRFARITGNTNVANIRRAMGQLPRKWCFECGAPGHSIGNAEKTGNASGNPDDNVVMGTFLLNNHYASILFDTGADRSFISTAFSSLINIALTPLENCYDVELADGKLVGIDTII